MTAPERADRLASLLLGACLLGHGAL